MDVHWPPFFEATAAEGGTTATHAAFSNIFLDTWTVAAAADRAVNFNRLEAGVAHDGGLAAWWLGFVHNAAAATYDVGCAGGSRSSAHDRFAFAELYVDVFHRGVEAKHVVDLGCAANEKGLPLVNSYNYFASVASDFPQAAAERLVYVDGTDTPLVEDGKTVSAVSAAQCTYTGKTDADIALCPWI